MEVNYIRPFDSWIDGSLSIAKKIVSVFENSQDFSLSEYKGQEDFYEEYISKYDDFVSLSWVPLRSERQLLSRLFVLI